MPLTRPLPPPRSVASPRARSAPLDIGTSAHKPSAPEPAALSPSSAMAMFASNASSTCTMTDLSSTLAGGSTQGPPLMGKDAKVFTVHVGNTYSQVRPPNSTPGACLVAGHHERVGRHRAGMRALLCGVLGRRSSMWRAF